MIPTNEKKGRGRILCGICDEPLVEHKLAHPCPKLKGERLSVPFTNPRGRPPNES